MRLCFVGDSIVNGTGDPEYLGWVGRVMQQERTRKPELTAYNLGIRRDRSDQIRSRWRREVECRLPAEYEGRVVFSFGANDAVQAMAAEVTLGHAEAILSEAKALWPVLLVGPTPFPDEMVSRRLILLDDAFAHLCARLVVPYVSVFEGLMNPSVWRDEAAAGDGAHPGAAGYRRFADLVLAHPAWQAWMASSLSSAA
jgi:lysophospholipase L1-like esterase